MVFIILSIRSHFLPKLPSDSFHQGLIKKISFLILGRHSLLNYIGFDTVQPEAQEYKLLKTAGSNFFQKFQNYFFSIFWLILFDQRFN